MAPLLDCCFVSGLWLLANFHLQRSIGEQYPINFVENVPKNYKKFVSTSVFDQQLAFPEPVSLTACSWPIDHLHGTFFGNGHSF